MKRILISFVAAIITATTIAAVHYLVNYSDDMHSLFHKGDEWLVVLIFFVVGGVYVRLDDKNR